MVVNYIRSFTMIYGYARISTRQQNIERQIRNIKTAYPTAVIVQEIFTGTTIARPKWEKLLKQVKPGDTIVFDSVSRMSRNAQDGFELYQKMYSENINLIFLKEPHINTDVYKQSLSVSIEMTGDEIADTFLEATNKVLLIIAQKQIALAFDQAEKEVTDLRQRTKEGIETARLSGKQIGQKPGNKLHVKKEDPAKEIIKKYSKKFDGTLNDKEVMKLAGVSHVTYYKYKREIERDLLNSI